MTQSPGPVKQTSIRTTVIYLVFFLACLIFGAAAGITRAEFGLILGVGMFGMALIMRETFTVVIGLWVLLFSACLFAVAFIISGFSVPRFVEMLTRGGDPPFLLNMATSTGVWGVLVVIASTLRRRWK